MPIDFEKFIERKNTCSVKWDYCEKIFGERDILPMWVADMDFHSPEVVVDAIKRRAEHGIFGYTGLSKSYNESVINWIKRRNSWDIQEKWIVHSPGVVTSINIAILAFTQPGEKIMIQSPVYHPFYSSIQDNERQLVVNPLILEDGKYTMDFDDLEGKLSEGVKMIILCSPHNPAGRVWRTDELYRVVELCNKYKVLIISDEIHSDLIFKGYKHTPIAALNDWTAENSITCISPTKTFNLAGLAESMAIIPNARLRHTFEAMLRRTGAGMENLFGQVAAEAAYAHGEEWLESLIRYLQGNLELLLGYFNERIPAVKAIIPEGTYLVWLDCRGLGMDAGSLKEFFVKQAGVGLNDGAMFGRDGTGFQRINIACPRSVLLEGLLRIERAVNRLGAK